jgi:hypothetical protein
MSFRGSGRVAAGRLRWPPSPGLPGPQSRWLTPERAHAHHRLHLRSHRHRGDHRCRDAHSQDATTRTVRGFALRKMRLPSVIQGLTKAPPGVISKKGAKTAAAAQLGAAVSASEKRGDARGFVGGREAALHQPADQRVLRRTVAMGHKRSLRGLRSHPIWTKENGLRHTALGGPRASELAARRSFSMAQLNLCPVTRRAMRLAWTRASRSPGYHLMRWPFGDTRGQKPIQSPSPRHPSMRQ